MRCSFCGKCGTEVERGGYDFGVAQSTRASESDAARRQAAARRMRGLFAGVAPERSLVDELLAERRAEAQAEDHAAPAGARPSWRPTASPRR